MTLRLWILMYMFMYTYIEISLLIIDILLTGNIEIKI